jgi:hypothetical protein
MSSRAGASSAAKGRMVDFAAMEHRHRCVYCAEGWSCDDDCPLPGPSACEACRGRIKGSPGTPRRVIALRAGSQVLDSLAKHEADRLRRLIGRDRQP